MSAIDHKAEAARIMAETIAGYTTLNDPHGAALTHATLALVEQTAELVKQQRIASLINLAFADGDVLTVTPTDATWARMFAEIREGLNLS